MRRIEPYPLWLGNAGDLRTPSHFCDAEIRAVVDLAANEPFPQLPRDLIYCRFPLFDGEGNDPSLLRAAVQSVKEFLTAGIPTAVCCSNGLSRSPAVVAAAVAAVQNVSSDEVLIFVAAHSKHDVSPTFWSELKHACLSRTCQ